MLTPVTYSDPSWALGMRLPNSPKVTTHCLSLNSRFGEMPTQGGVTVVPLLSWMRKASLEMVEGSSGQLKQMGRPS